MVGLRGTRCGREPRDSYLPVTDNKRWTDVQRDGIRIGMNTGSKRPSANNWPSIAGKA